MFLRKRDGFTIVELLIVIVVIAILAAITIVAYNGIQSRSKSSSIQSLSTNVLKKIETYGTLSGGVYPASVSNFADYNESKLDGLNVINWTSSPGAIGNPNTVASYDEGKRVIYRRISLTCGTVDYYNYQANARASSFFGTNDC